MSPLTHPTTLLILVILGGSILIIQRLLSHRLRNLPGPWTYAVSTLPLAWEEWQGRSTRTIHALHKQYGPAVRIGPDEVSFNSLAALKTIYGAGSRAERTAFYKLFEPYGLPTMFTMPAGRDHAERKKMLARAYAKSGLLTGEMARMVEERVDWFLRFVQTHQGESDAADTVAVEIGEPLHFFSLDVSSAFIYGPGIGTTSLKSPKDRVLFEDFEHPLRRRLSWAAMHGMPSRIVNLVLTVWETWTGQKRKAAPFTRLRQYGKDAFAQFQQTKSSTTQPPFPSLIEHLWPHQSSLTDLQLASECVDHLLAGVETTRNTLLFLIWTLSLPEHIEIQQTLRSELHQHQRTLSVEACDTLPYLTALLKEALRLYDPLPALQPRQFPTDTVIDGHAIPARTTVSAAAYTLHRNEAVFPSPEKFQPQRWLDTETPTSEKSKWHWPFSSGARMCTGSHLAMAEMTTLIAGIYARYETSIPTDFRGVSPGITSRFERFWDERFECVDEGRCPIEFHLLNEQERG